MTQRSQLLENRNAVQGSGSECLMAEFLKIPNAFIDGPIPA
jgi:hypothetical protein